MRAGPPIGDAIREAAHQLDAQTADRGRLEVLRRRRQLMRQRIERAAVVGHLGMQGRIVAPQRDLHIVYSVGRERVRDDVGNRLFQAKLDCMHRA